MPQVVAEFWNVATRPDDANGIGMTPAEALAALSEFEKTFPLLPDGQGAYPIWRDIVAGLGVVGKQTHDARLVAAAESHELTHVLTFNVRHFVRLVGHNKRLVVLDAASPFSPP